MRRQNSKSWRFHRIFLSSTFKDMHPERDVLRGSVFPKFQQTLFHHKVDLSIIDLRQGVETGEEADQQARDNKVLDVCLRAIDKSHPFFLGIVGDRYGWVPPANRILHQLKKQHIAEKFTDYLSERDLPKTKNLSELCDHQFVSATELEIIYALLRQTSRCDAPERCFHIFLRNLDYSGMDPTTRAKYDERPWFDSSLGFLDLCAVPEAEQEAARRRWESLTLFKGWISANHSEHVTPFPARWDASATPKGKVCSDFGELVLQRLEADFETIGFSSFQSRKTSPKVYSDTDAIERFSHQASRYAIERPPVIERVVRFCNASEEGKAICLVGEPGSGKSTIFAQLRKTLANTGDVVLLEHSTGIFPGSESIDRLLKRWILQLSTIIDEKLSEDRKSATDETPDEARRLEIAGIPIYSYSNVGEKHSAEETNLEFKFQHLLKQACKNLRVVILIDSLEGLEETRRGRLLTWLPPQWPSNLRFIGTTTGAEETKDLLSKDYWLEAKSIDIPALTKEEAQAIALQLFKDCYFREVNSKALERILNKRIPAPKEEYYPGSMSVVDLLSETPGFKESWENIVGGTLTNEQFRAICWLSDEKKDVFLREIRKDFQAGIDKLMTAYANRDADLGFSFSNPLWLVTCLHELNFLSQEDFERSDQFDPNLSGSQKMDMLLVDAADQMPPTTVEAFAPLIERCEKYCGVLFTENVLTLLAVSRSGLRESDLRDLLPEMTGEPWDALNFEQLLLILGSNIYCSGAAEFWQFAHVALSKAVEHRYFPPLPKLGFTRIADPKSRSPVSEKHKQEEMDSNKRKAQTRIADYIAKLPKDDPFRLSEFFYFKFELQDKRGLATELSSNPLIWNQALEETANRVFNSGPADGRHFDGTALFAEIDEKEKTGKILERQDPIAQNALLCSGPEVRMLLNILNPQNQETGNAELKLATARFCLALIPRLDDQSAYCAAIKILLAERVFDCLSEEYKGSADFEESFFLELSIVVYDVLAILGMLHLHQRRCDASVEVCKMSLSVLEDIKQISRIARTPIEPYITETLEAFSRENLALAEYSDGQSECALQSMKKAVSILKRIQTSNSESNNNQTITRLPQCLYHASNWCDSEAEQSSLFRQSISELDKQIELVPNSYQLLCKKAEMLSERGRKCFERGDFGDGSDHLNQSLKIMAEVFPRNSDKLSVDWTGLVVLNNKAVSMMIARDHKNAIPEFRNVVRSLCEYERRNPQDTKVVSRLSTTLANLAICYREIGKAEGQAGLLMKALKFAERLSKWFPHNEDYLKQAERMREDLEAALISLESRN